MGELPKKMPYQGGLKRCRRRTGNVVLKPEEVLLAA
jgi:hypothetical protein